VFTPLSGSRALQLSRLYRFGFRSGSLADNRLRRCRSTCMRFHKLGHDYHARNRLLDHIYGCRFNLHRIGRGSATAAPRGRRLRAGPLVFGLGFLPFAFCFDRAPCGLLLCGFRFLRCLTTSPYFARCYAFGPFRHRTLALIEHPRGNQTSSINCDADKASERQISSTEEMPRQGAAVRSRGAFRRAARREPCNATGTAAPSSAATGWSPNALGIPLRASSVLPARGSRYSFAGLPMAADQTLIGKKCWRGTEAPRPCCRYLSFHGPPRHR